MEEPKKNEPKNAVSIADLERDKQDLIRQVQTISGAIQYITQKIADLSKEKGK